MTYFSKNYTTGANLTAGATSAEEYITELDQLESGPFDQITITNRGTVDLRINLDNNTNNGLKCPPGHFSFLDLKFKSFNITNVSSAGTHTAGEVNILVENTRFPRRK